MGPPSLSVMKGPTKSFVVGPRPLTAGWRRNESYGKRRGRKQRGEKPFSAGYVSHANRPAWLNPREAHAGTA